MDADTAASVIAALAGLLLGTSAALVVAARAQAADMRRRVSAEADCLAARQERDRLRADLARAGRDLGAARAELLLAAGERDRLRERLARAAGALAGGDGEAG